MAEYIIVKEYFDLGGFSCIEIAKALDLAHATVVKYLSRYLSELTKTNINR